MITKMNPKFTYNHLIFFLIISLYPLGFFGQNNPDDATCGEPFQCANLSNLTYPFWNLYSNTDRNNLTLCGPPAFGLNCLEDSPILKTSPLDYRILELDFLNYSMKVTRNDLWVDLCHPILLDTTISSKNFEIPLDSGYKNVTLYYDCISHSPKTLPNQFTCGSNKTVNFFDAGNVSKTDFTCEKKIIVPVNESALESLVLHAALTNGFTIKWSADDAKCGQCTRLKGTCAYALNSSSFTCQFTSERRHNPLDPPPAPSPRAPKTRDNAPAESPSNTTSANTIFMPPKPKGKVFNATRVKLGVIFGSIGFTLVIVYISWLCKRRHCPSAPENPHIDKFLLQNGSLAPKRYTYSEIKKITKSFNDKLGQGGYGSVYKGSLLDGSFVAIKVLFETDTNDEDFINEVVSISRTSHVNVVSLLGFCYEKKKRALVYEFMPNNSLDKFIKDANTGQDTGILYNIAVGVAKGLEYLHKGCTTSIIHFDIKPQNILLDERFNPKIADFGLAKLCKKMQSILSVPGTRGTVGYIAPEVFSRNFGSVSHKSDVYSYGIMVLEMVGVHKFVQAETIQSSENYFPDKIYTQVIESGHAMKNVDYNKYKVEQEDERVRKMSLVGFWCMQTMPSDRPPMSKVLEMLEGNLASIPIPPKPFLFNPNQMGQEFSSSAEYGSGTMTYTTMTTSTTYTTTTTSGKEDA